MEHAGRHVHAAGVVAENACVPHVRDGILVRKVVAAVLEGARVALFDGVAVAVLDLNAGADHVSRDAERLLVEVRSRLDEPVGHAYL